jgi:Domain of unknown function (DUF4136)
MGICARQPLSPKNGKANIPTRRGREQRARGAPVKRYHSFLPALVALVLLAACSPKAPRHVELYPGVRFTSYQTYQWIKVPQRPTGDRRETGVVDWHVHHAVDGALGARGFRPRDIGIPDFLVNYRITVDHKMTESFGEYARYLEEGGDQAMSEAFAFGYDRAVLTLEMLDPSTRAVLWRGTTSMAVDRDHVEDHIQTAVAYLLEDFPPPPPED